MSLQQKIDAALSEQWARKAQPKIELRLPFPPSVNALWKHGGLTGVYRSPRYMSWLNVAGNELNRQKPGCITGSYRIRITLGRRDAKRRDQDNFAKAISDLLVHHHVVSDDSLATSTTIDWSDRIDGCRVILTAAKSTGTTIDATDLLPPLEGEMVT
jgi:Holliday junction resolvase RusA-like endonuclease